MEIHENIIMGDPSGSPHFKIKKFARNLFFGHVSCYFRDNAPVMGRGVTVGIRAWFNSQTVHGSEIRVMLTR